MCLYVHACIPLGGWFRTNASKHPFLAIHKIYAAIPFFYGFILFHNFNRRGTYSSHTSTLLLSTIHMVRSFQFLFSKKSQSSEAIAAQTHIWLAGGRETKAMHKSKWTHHCRVNYSCYSFNEEQRLPFYNNKTVVLSKAAFNIHTSDTFKEWNLFECLRSVALFVRPEICKWSTVSNIEML